jgi:protein phosphatase 2C family protein 2/3
MLYGPYRVLPGRLSVSRTFGDIEAKQPKFGGKPGVVIAEPEISQFTINENVHDFIVLGCDGIFDRLTSVNVIDSSWTAMAQAIKLQKKIDPYNQSKK